MACQSGAVANKAFIMTPFFTDLMLKFFRFSMIPLLLLWILAEVSVQQEKDCQSDVGVGCSSSEDLSIDEDFCIEESVYNPENIVVGRNRLCCLHKNFRQNALQQVTRCGGTRNEARFNFRATRDACCETYKYKSEGIDALKTLGCPFDGSRRRARAAKPRQRRAACPNQKEAGITKSETTTNTKVFFCSSSYFVKFQGYHFLPRK